MTIPTKNLYPCLLGCLFCLDIATCLSQKKFPAEVYPFIENPATTELNQEPGHVPFAVFKPLISPSLVTVIIFNFDYVTSVVGYTAISAPMNIV